MNGKVHFLFGAAAGVALSVMTETDPVVPAVLLSAVGSLLPDIDQTKSTAGRFLIPISYPLEKYVGHRTFTHDPVVYIPLLILSLIFCPTLAYLFLGIYSHILLDMFTPMGIPVLWFIRKDRSYVSLLHISHPVIQFLFTLLLSCGIFGLTYIVSFA